MANFVKVGDSEYVINLEQVIWVDTDVVNYNGEPQPGAIRIMFAVSGFEGGPTWIQLDGDNAERFMNTLDRQTGVW